MNYENAIKKRVLTFRIFGKAKINKNTLIAKNIYESHYQRRHYNDNA